MSDAFKNRLPGRGCRCCQQNTKTGANRQARARLAQDDLAVIAEGAEEYNDQRLEADDNCGDPHCCECGDGAGCEGCYFCERGEFAPGEDDLNL